MKRALFTAGMAFLLLSVILAFIGCGGLPDVKFNKSVNGGPAPLNVAFTNTTEVSGDDTSTVFKWDFGDGKTLETSNAKEPVSHEYTKTGTYTITLSIYKKDSPENKKTLSQNVTVTHGAVDSVKITPQTVTLNIGQSQTFKSEVLDIYGNLISTAVLVWKAEAGAITDTGTLVAGTTAGTFTPGVTVDASLDSYSAHSSASVTVNPDPLATASLPAVEIAAGGTIQLEVVAEDKYGNVIENLETTWKLLNTEAGAITDKGLFTAQKKAGSFEQAIEVQVKQGDKVLQAKGKVTIVPAALSQIGIAPGKIDLGMGMTQQYVAVGADKYGNRISGVSFTWSAISSAGTMTAKGLFTAGNNPGTYKDGIIVTATKESLAIIKTTDVIVNPDRILFFSNRADETSTNLDIYIMDIDGSNVQRVITSQGTQDLNISCSPDGRRFVFAEIFDSGSTVYLANVDGSQQISIVTGKRYYEPNWSHDGQKIAFQSWEDDDGEIFIMDIDGGNMVRLTDNTLYDDFPDWSPNGSKIVYVSQPNSSTDAKIYVMNTDGSGKQQLTTGSGYDILPQWSPDSTQIAFQTSRGALITYSVFVMNADGSNLRAISSSSAFNSDGPSWSPDGTKIAFLNFTSANQGEIYTVNVDGTNLTRLTNNTARDMWPKWLPRAQGVKVTEASAVIATSFDVPSMTAQQITAMASPAVVRIKTNLGSGTGFIIGSSGLIMTNNHVISDATEITVYLTDGTSYAGTVQSRDMVRDLAIVKIQATGLPTLEIASLDGVSAGQQVYVLGYPLGQENVSVTSGLLSSIEFDDGRNVTWLQTDSAVNPGNSGGPLLDSQGRVIGVVAAKMVGVSVEGIGFAISANTVNTYLSELLD
ncbi:MAG: hypothetical protein A2Z15_02820 [Chloroflexi bacterium RBG_16_50_11]|nr:MAG: hypothetical protein A2Z15_02820 [Chloroflexi bacterium RBG_16_50_11]